MVLKEEEVLVSDDSVGDYKEQAEYYDAVYEAQGKDYLKESQVVIDVIQQNKQTDGNALLDVGCGTGGHFPYLAEVFETTGLDLDPHMLQVARNRFPDATFIQGDMRNFDLEGKQFDAITCLFSAIGYARTLEGLHQAITTMAKHLKKGGVLVVEPWLFPDEYTEGKEYSITVTKPEYTLTRSNVSEKRDNLSVINFHFDITHADGTKEEFDELHELALFTPDEYMEAFRQAGLEVKFDKQGITGRGLFIGTKS